MTSLGRQLAAAIAGRDRDVLLSLLADDVDFKALTPGRLWEAETPDAVAAVVFDNWFLETDRITRIAAVDEGEVADTSRVGYRFEMECPDGARVAEQQAYYRARDQRIAHLRVMCSGFRER